MQNRNELPMKDLEIIGVVKMEILPFQKRS